MTRILHGLLLAVSLGLPGLSIQASDDWYHIELMVFAHERASDEQWRRDRQPDYAAPYIHFSEHGAHLPDDASDAQRHALSQGAWQLASNLAMDEMRERMTQSGNYRTLFHYSWRQPIGAREQALPIYVEGGGTLTPAAPSPAETQGNDTLRELSDPARPDDAFYAAIASPPPARVPELQGTLVLSESRFLHVEPNLWLTLTDEHGEHYFASLTQSRRLRAGELHYLDNPRLGVLIKVSH